MPVFIKTIPGWSATISPMSAAAAPSGCLRMRSSVASAASAHYRQQLAFVRDIEGVEPEDFACAMNSLADGYGLLLQLHSDLRSSRKLIQGGCDPATSWIAQAMDMVASRLQHGCYQVVQRSTVTLDCPFKLEPLATTT